METEYERPIYTGPARGAKVAALAIVIVFLIWMGFAWPRDGDDSPQDEPRVELEEGTLPPVVGDGAAGELPATG